jgi:hypothetical protein
MIVRRLSDTGIARFAEYVDSLSSEKPLPYPEDLLESEDDAVPFAVKIEIEDIRFETRLAAAEYLHGRFSDPRLQGIENETGVWAWLALFYFEQLCKTDDEGNYRPGEMARWIPENDNFRKYYRHLLRGPFSIYNAHREEPARALALLCGPLQEPGDVVEQLSARQELVTNSGVVKLATILYYDPEKKRLRRGAAGRGPGSARRLADLFNQLDITWDLYGMAAEKLVVLLPAEFNKFRQPSAG